MSIRDLSDSNPKLYETPDYVKGLVHNKTNRLLIVKFRITYPNRKIADTTKPSLR